MNFAKLALSALFALILGLGLVGCDKPGPAEEAGKAIDEAASDAADAAQDAADTVEKKMGE